MRAYRSRIAAAKVSLSPGGRRRAGFTLIEILCVVVILGIASAIVIPQIGSRDDLVVSAAARVVMADLIYAQNRAIATQKKHYIHFSGQQYTVSDSSTLAAISNPVSKQPYIVTFGAASTGLSTVALQSWSFGGPSTIGFDELGSPFGFDGTTATALTSSGQVAIGCNTASLTISVEPYTGEATVH